MLNDLNNVTKIIVEYPDRLARFGFIYLKCLANKCDVEIEVFALNELAQEGDIDENNS